MYVKLDNLKLNKSFTWGNILTNTGRGGSGKISGWGNNLELAQNSVNYAKN